MKGNNGFGGKENPFILFPPHHFYPTKQGKSLFPPPPFPSFFPRQIQPHIEIITQCKRSPSSVMSAVLFFFIKELILPKITLELLFSSFHDDYAIFMILHH